MRTTKRPRPQPWRATTGALIHMKGGPMFKSTDQITAGIEEAHGGYLRCETCRRVESTRPDDGGPSYFTSGWPKCCGYTMRWWTARQIRAGEVSA